MQHDQTRTFITIPSNAVLSPELNTCEFPMKKHVTYRADFESNNSDLKADDIAFRKKWCEQQVSLIR